MNTTRRKLLMFAGGSTVGVLFTPAPWRLITDSALWSETWPGVPMPARGEIRVRYTNCSLCPAGCAVRARCVGDQPVQLSGVADHPLSHGALCPFGLGGHHLPYHPGRVTQGPVAEATAAVAQGIAECGPSEHVVTLDLRPARTASWTYRRAMAAVKNGVYATPPVESAAAIDLAAARTVISFGVPLLDGWGTPGNVIAARDSFRLIQVDPVESRTASLANRWLRVRPGSEDSLAQALAGTMTHAAASSSTGIPEAEIAAVASELQQNGPVLVLGSSRLPSSGRTVVARRETPVPAAWRNAAPSTDWASLADRSVRVLLIDEAAPGEYLPWHLIEKKLVADNPVVVAFAWTPEGYARHAQYVLPAGVYPEVADDIPPAADSVAATFRLSAALVAAPDGVIEPVKFVARAAGLPLGDPLRERADAIHQAGRGTLFTYADAKRVELKTVSADDFWKALNAGACWIDAPDEKATVARLAPVAVPASAVEEAELPLTVALTGALTPASPILSKLYCESNLRLAPQRVALHPSNGLAEDTQAVLQTVLGKCAVTVTLDPGIPLGMVQAPATPAILDLCAPGARAKVVRS